MTKLVDIDWSRLVTATEKELKAKDTQAKLVRLDRDKRLAATDFYLLPDVPTMPEGLLMYRQALRDVTEQSGFPDFVEWPIL